MRLPTYAFVYTCRSFHNMEAVRGSNRLSGDIFLPKIIARASQQSA